MAPCMHGRNTSAVGAGRNVRGRLATAGRTRRRRPRVRPPAPRRRTGRATTGGSRRRRTPGSRAATRPGRRGDGTRRASWDRTAAPPTPRTRARRSRPRRTPRRARTRRRRASPPSRRRTPRRPPCPARGPVASANAADTVPTAWVAATSSGSMRRRRPDAVQRLVRPRARPGIEQRQRRGVRMVDGPHPGRLRQHERAGRHEPRGPASNASGSSSRIHSALNAACDESRFAPDRSRRTPPATRARASAAACASARRSIQIMRRAQRARPPRRTPPSRRAASRTTALHGDRALRHRRGPAGRRSPSTASDPERPGPVRPMPGRGNDRSYASYAEATSVPSASYRAAFVPWLPTSQPMTYGAGHRRSRDRWTHLRARRPDRIVSNASRDVLQRRTGGSPPGELVPAAVEVAHRDPVLAVASRRTRRGSRAPCSAARSCRAG